MKRKHPVVNLISQRRLEAAHENLTRHH
jgi:hypothetical protein